MNAYYRTWDSLTAEQKATETASQAQALYANGRPAEAAALLASLRPAFDLTATMARINAMATPLDEMPGVRFAERHAYSPSKIARNR